MKTLHTLGLFKLLLYVMSILGAYNGVRANDDQEWQATVDPPKIRQVMELTVRVGPAVEIGDSDHGERRFIPITGGHFVGKGLQGKVADGGADWQLERPDGVLEIDALYSLVTDDGANIIVHNQGIVVKDPESEDFSSAYVRTSPQFHAPAGKYQWLNERIFTGTITPQKGGGAVIIRVFEIQ